MGQLLGGRVVVRKYVFGVEVGEGHRVFPFREQGSLEPALPKASPYYPVGDADELSPESSALSCPVGSRALSHDRGCRRLLPFAELRPTLAGVTSKLDAAERIRALVAGPPAYVLRRRRIEDLEAAILKAIRTNEAKTGPVSPSSPPPAVKRWYALLHELIEAHNRYYPIEAVLPIDAITGALLDFGGRPWAPMRIPTLPELIERAR